MRYQFTPKVQKHLDILHNFEAGPVYPYQLFANFMYEPTGVCPEVFIYLVQHLGKENVYYFKESGDELREEVNTREVGGQVVSESMRAVCEEANKRRIRYNQGFITEGHIFHAILTKDPITAKLIPAPLREEIRSFTSVPRDMAVNLRHYVKPKIVVKDEIVIKRAELADQEELEKYIGEGFGEAWVETARNAFEKETKPLYIARDVGKRIIGFACYDSVRHQRGVYGPMGTSPSVRTRGVGYALLHTCLEEMKHIGYEYAILGEAGPIEYYERNCGATLIPLNVY